MKSQEKELTPFKILAWILFAILLGKAQSEYFAPEPWDPEPGWETAEPDADPFPFFGSEEQKQAWRGRHPIKTWTQPSTW